MNSKIDLRPSPLAGRWYPADPDTLTAMVDGYIRDAHLPGLDGQVIAVMAPHAGYVYSGPVAGYAFAAVSGLQPDLVAVISPSHYPYPQALLTTTHAAYSTPLGIIPVDNAAVRALEAALQIELGFGLTAVKQDPEHSLEIELPFLQHSLHSTFQLLPVMVRDQTSRTVRCLGRALASVLKDRNALLVASTDLSHFYPENIANTLDAVVLARVEAFDPEGILQVEEKGQGFACGKGALAAVLWAAKELGADTVKILRHATSGDVTGDFSEVVGYGAAAVLRKA